VASPSTSKASAPDVLQRRDPQTGKVEASAKLGRTVRDVVETDSTLWLSTATYSSSSASESSRLEALDPSTLKQIGSTKLPAEANATLGLTAAGGNIWVVDGSELIGVKQSTRVVSHVSAASPLAGPNAIFTAVTSPEHGQGLIDSAVASNEPPVLQIRDTATGSLDAQAYAIHGLEVSHLSAYRNDLWVSIVTGNDGYVQRWSLATFAPSTFTTPEGSNAVTATVYNHTLFVTDTGGGNAANYCGNPAGGASLGTLIHASRPAEFLTAGPYSYFVVPNIGGTTHRIQAASIPTPCR
jgi:hypothetical protein